MTKMIAILASALLATSVYAKTENADSHSKKETSRRNPLTGKTTHKTVEKEEMKDGTGEAEATKTTKTVTDKDGKVIKKKVDIEAEGEAK